MRHGEEVRATLDEFTGKGAVWLCAYSAGNSGERWQQWELSSVPLAVHTTLSWSEPLIDTGGLFIPGLMALAKDN